MSLFFLAKRFVAGEDFTAAIPVIQQLNDKGIHVTVNMLGEHVKERTIAEQVRDEYLGVVDHIRRARLDANISIKPTQIGMDVSDDVCYQLIAPVVAKAAEHDIFIRLDMEGSPYTQRTIDLLYRLREQNANVGIVIQAYLHRSEADVEAMNRQKIHVRLCKGAYKEPREIAFQDMDKEIRPMFIKLAKRLITEGVYPGIATHDELIITAIKTFVAEQQISRDRFEFQMLYGIRVDSQEKLAQEGYHIRTYVPYGPHWAPYFYRRLRERKENVWFVVKNLFKK